MRESMMQTAIKALLRDTGLTKKEVVEVYQGLASGYEVRYHEQLLDIERRRCQFLFQIDEVINSLTDAFNLGLSNLQKDYLLRSQMLESLISKTVAIRNVELKAATDAAQLQAVYDKYDPEIEQYKVQRNELVGEFHQKKDKLVREYKASYAKSQDDKRSQLLVYKELVNKLNDERASMRRKEVERWYMIIDERMAKKGGQQ